MKAKMTFKRRCFEIPVKPHKESDGGMGFYIGWGDDWIYGRWDIGVYFGKYLIYIYDKQRKLRFCNSYGIEGDD